jgi:galactose mutarotase-like enzyme
VSVGDGRIAPSGEQVEISFGHQLAVVVEVGGGLRSYSSAGRDVLDGYGVDEPSASARDDDGRARVRLRDPDSAAAVTLWVDESYEYLMLFTGDTRPDVNRRSLAVEPMTCPPNAFRTGDSLIRLEPGGSTTSTWGTAPS